MQMKSSAIAEVSHDAICLEILSTVAHLYKIPIWKGRQYVTDFEDHSNLSEFLTFDGHISLVITNSVSLLDCYCSYVSIILHRLVVAITHESESARDLQLNCLIEIEGLLRRQSPLQRILVNTCHISQGTGVRTVSNSKSDLQGHRRSLVLDCWCHSVGKATCDFLLVFHCNYVSILYRLRVISYVPKCKEITWPKKHPLRGGGCNLSCMYAYYIVLVNVSLCTKYEMPSFTHSEVMTNAPKFEKGRMTLTVPLDLSSVG